MRGGGEEVAWWFVDINCSCVLEGATEHNGAISLVESPDNGSLDGVVPMQPAVGHLEDADDEAKGKTTAPAALAQERALNR